MRTMEYMTILTSTNILFYRIIRTHIFFFLNTKIEKIYFSKKIEMRFRKGQSKNVSEIKVKNY